MAEFNLPFGVRISNNNPLDADRYVQDDVSARDILLTEERAYEGLQVYVKSDNKLYLMTDASGVWVSVIDASVFDASINQVSIKISNQDVSIDWLKTYTDGSLAFSNNLLSWDSSNKNYTPYVSRAIIGTTLGFYNDPSFLVPSANHTNTLSLNAALYAGSGNSSYGGYAFYGTSYSGTTNRNISTTGIASYSTSTSGIANRANSGSGTGGSFSSNTGNCLDVYSSATLSTNKTARIAYIFRNEICSSFNISGTLLDLYDNPTFTSGVHTGRTVSATIGTTDRFWVYPRVPDSSSAIAYLYDTDTSLVTTGALHSSFKNNGTELISIDFNGNINIKLGANYKINGSNLSAIDIGAEPSLGNPAYDDYILSKKIDGSVVWVAPGMSSMITTSLIDSSITNLVIGNKLIHNSVKMEYVMVNGSMVRSGMLKVLCNSTYVSDPSQGEYEEMGGFLNVHVSDCYINGNDIIVAFDTSVGSNVILKYNLMIL